MTTNSENNEKFNYVLLDSKEQEVENTNPVFPRSQPSFGASFAKLFKELWAFLIHKPVATILLPEPFDLEIFIHTESGNSISQMKEFHVYLIWNSPQDQHHIKSPPSFGTEIQSGLRTN